jgi:hypothetical protein
LWGIRTLNGICSLVRIPYPYSEWNLIYSWPYGETVYDLDLSPDSELVSASVGDISGKQTVRIMKAASLLARDATPMKQFDFGAAVPSNFIFSADGRFLFGSSYYSGVSNIFRYEIANGDVQALSNTDTGFFRPMPYDGDSLLVFRYTGEGFVPAIVPAKPLQDVSAITFLGQQLVEKYPVLKDWAAGSPGAVPIESMITHRGTYDPLRRLGLESIYPLVEGYKDTIGYGAHVRLSDPAELNGASLTASYSPAGNLDASERLHLVADYRRYNWDGRVAWNAADFYDIFGPTKRSRRGYSIEAGHLNILVFDEPRHLELKVRGRFAGHLDQLPEYQNIAVNVDTLLTGSANLSYTDVRSSLGSVDDEKGRRWSVELREDYANQAGFTKAYGTYDEGFALPLGHSSVWIRSAAGVSPQDPAQPFANFYFGGFGNNYVDIRDEKQYREYYGFPGMDLNAVGGRNFAKSMIEWNAPPLRFRRVGSPGFYVSWMRPAVFVGGLVTNLDDSTVRRTTKDVGAQLDFRLNVLSNLDMTLSFGAAVAFDQGQSHREAMISVRVLR